VEQETRENTGAVRPLLSLLCRHPWPFTAVLLLGIMASLVEGIGISLFIPFLGLLEPGGGQGESQSWLVRFLGDVFSGIPLENRVPVMASCIFGAVVLKSVLVFLNLLVSGWLDSRIGHWLRSEIFDRLLTVRFRFWDRTSSGRLLNVLSTETWRTCQAIQVFVRILIATCLLAAHGALLLLISWRLAFLVSAALAVMLMIVKIITRRVEKLGEKATAINAVLTTRMIEGISGMKVIRAFNREAYEQDRFDRYSDRVSRVFMKLGVLSGSVEPVYEILASALLVFVLCTTLTGPGDMAACLVFLFVLYRMFPRVQELDAARIGLSSLTASVLEVSSHLDHGDRSARTGRRILPGKLKKGISFHHATFRYDSGAGETPAIQDLSLCIPAGKTTALVGPSGAGKSTMIRLILRFYDVMTGEIRVDDTRLQDLDLAAWRSRIALVSQDVFIFNTTVKENIAYGRPGATDAEIEVAARQALAHDFIKELPFGYDTIVGERGMRLSGGQQQRITLARAIIRNPDILILDEATNALDSIAEHLIQKSLDRFRGGRTVIVIAHRLSTIEEADHVVVLDRGRVCEQGTFRELCENDDLFTRLHELQYQGEPVGRSGVPDHA